MSIEDYTAQSVLESEQACTLLKFDAETAWTLGSTVRQLAKDNYPSLAVKIDIISANGEQLFHSTFGDGTSPDNDNWVRRKRNTVLKFQNSSFYIGRKLSEKARSLSEASYYDEKDYAVHGGAVPIKVKNYDGGIVGVLTVSGLKQWEDHYLAIEALKSFASN